MWALIWVQLALFANGTATVELESTEELSWRARSLEVVVAGALEERPITFRGTLDREHLRFTASLATTPTPTATATPTPTTTPPRRVVGVIKLRGLSVAGLERVIQDSVEGLKSPEAAAALEHRAAAISRSGVFALILGAALVLVLPLLLFAPAILRAPLRAIRERRSILWTVVCLILLAGLGAALIHADSIAAWWFYGAGGIAWGALISANLRLVFPVFSGLGRVEHRDVFRLLRTWLWVAFLRGLRRAAYYAPFFFALWFAARASGISVALLLMVVTPVFGLLARFWLLSIVENAAFVLDRRLVVGPADEGNPWHEAVRGYYLGYVKRLGWEEGAALTRNVLFLPGRGQELAIYGGGITPSRVVIGTELLEFGLAPYGRPHDYEAPREDKLFWSDWHIGLIVPTKAGQVIADRASRHVVHIAEPGDEDAPLHLGQPPTLAGFVEPSALDNRLTHRPAEDPTWLEWDPGNKHDGTDPGDHDFLFGALVWKLGLIQRHEDQRQTLTSLLGPAVSRTPGIVRKLGIVLATPYRLLFSRPHSELGDAFAAVNYAQNHLVQYLAWLLWRDDAFLTSRALAPELQRETRSIYAHLESAAPSRGPASERLHYLSSFVDSEPVRAGARWRRRLPLAVAVVAIVGLISFNVIRAINYHPRYQQGQEQEQEQSKQMLDTHPDDDSSRQEGDTP